MLVSRRFLGDYVIDALTKDAPDFRASGDDAWSIGTQLLRDIGVNLVIYGRSSSRPHSLAGPSRVRVRYAGGLHPRSCIGRSSRMRSVACAFLLLVLLGPTDAQRLVPLIVLFGFGFLGVEVLRRQVAREFPDAAVGA